MVMWEPHKYADRIGGFNEVVGPLLIWAVCSSMIYGVGFKQDFGCGKYCLAHTSRL